MSDQDDNDSVAIRRSDLDNLIYIAAAIGVAGSFFLFGLFLWNEWRNPGWNGVFLHFPATVGLPCAAAGSFIVIALFRVTEGTIKFKGPGFEFEGASGPIVLWAMCFPAITAAIRIVWPLTLLAAP
ncbi:hypothetical protein HB771_34105 (plasmid) [Rhizobium leguminosarum bv. viciae]|nr:hypothetical protein HB771_34105 [Rhizobium leguminosarum bv. viciae]